MNVSRFVRFLILGLCTLFVTGCTVDSYPPEKIKESLADICRKEYGIAEIDVKIVGTTIGVYLPLKELFAADFAEAAVSGKVRNLETLFEPSADAMNKVEDVLFSISRVILSTSRKLDFYVLFATDIEKTGLQLVLVGNVDDIKRVRVWDISRDEYRKRVIHELRLSRGAIYQKTVREFFRDLHTLPLAKIREKYFSSSVSDPVIQSLFLNQLAGEGPEKKPATNWDILDLRSIPFQGNRSFVYAKVRPIFASSLKGEDEEGPAMEYLFLLAIENKHPQLVRVIPFQFQGPSGQLQKIPFPEELQISQNLDQWESDFEVKEVQMGPVLAQQLTRRAQALAAMDERIQNTFRDVKLNFDYAGAPPASHFSLGVQATLKDLNNYPQGSIMLHEDMLYLLNIVSREFVDVLRGYHFGEYEHLTLRVAQEPYDIVLAREDLELFRRKKLDMHTLLASLPNL